MKCRTVIDRISESIDGRLRGSGQDELRRHLAQCPECSSRYSRLADICGSVRSLPALLPPRELTTRLRIGASQEVLRRRGRWGAALEDWRDVAALWARNLLEPLALPLAGGLLSAVFLFTMLAPMYGIEGRYLIRDVPTILSTGPTLRSPTLSFGTTAYDVVVDVLVDDQGRLLDYSVPPGQVWQQDRELRREIENTLLWTQFTPATAFGQPRSGTVRISLRRNLVEVKG
jgi:hypothetical protein